MSENFNLIEILKDCPKGTKLYSTVHGEVSFVGNQESFTNEIAVMLSDKSKVFFDAYGKLYSVFDGECILFPSKDQRDWSKFTAPWHKKEKFDPKTLKSFDKVLGRNGLDIWRCDFFSSYMETYACKNVCIGSYYSYCIPYNEDTKLLVGTNDEAPEYYRYWED